MVDYFIQKEIVLYLTSLWLVCRSLEEMTDGRLESLTQRLIIRNKKK